jgi:hypothetical protein
MTWRYLDMAYSVKKIVLEISGPQPQDIRVLSEEGTQLETCPQDEIRALYERPGGIRHYGEILFDDLGSRVANEGCFAYVHLNCRWYKVPVGCP